MKGTQTAAISYTGLEPITDNLAAADRVFTFNGGAETITLTTGMTLNNRIDSTLGEFVEFNNPSESLTINAGTGNDIITIAPVHAGFNAALTVNGGDGNDSINLNGDLSLGSGTVIGNLSFTAESIDLGADVSTDGGNDSGTALFNGAVVLSADVVIDTDGGGIDGTVQFNGTINGANALTINAGTAATTLTGAVGGMIALSSLTTDTGGTTNINGGAVTTSAAQTYNNGVLLGQNTTLSATMVSFGSTLNSEAGETNSLAITGTADFNGIVGGVDRLSSVAVSLTTSLDGGVVNTTGNQTYTGNATLGADTVLTSGGLVNFQGMLDGARSLAINGNADFDGAVGGTALTSLSVSGTTSMNATTVMTSGAQNYIGAVTLLSGTTINGVGITFGNTLNGARTLVINDSGATVFEGAIGGITPLTSLTTDTGGTTAINGGSVATTGSHTYSDAVTLGQHTALSGTTLTFVSLNSAPSETNSLAITGDAVFNAAVGGVDRLSSLSVSGTTALDGGAVSTTGNQTYSSDTTLGADATLTVGGNLSLAAVNDDGTAGDANLTLAVTGTTTLNAALGGGAALTSLNLDTAGPLAVGVNITTTNLLDITVNDTAATGDNLTIVSGTILQSTGGNIALAAGDNFTLQSGATLNANGTASITVDAGTSDVGTGATVTIDGTITAMGTGTTITGGADVDTFDINPQATGSPITVNGGNPTTSPGDALILDVAAVTGTNLMVTAARAGTFSFTSAHASVSFSNIESLSAVGGTFAVSPIDTGTGDDTIVLSRSGGDLVVTVGGSQYFRAAVASIAGGLVINGNDGNDSLTVDYSGGNPIPVGGLTFNGGMQTVSDSLRVSGGSFTNIIKTFTNANDGTINLDGDVITYTGLEPVLLNVGSVNNIIFNLPGGATDDNAILEDDTPTLVADTSRLRSQAGTPTFETTTFTNPSNSLTINMGASSGNFTISPLDSGFAAKSPSVTIHGEGANDTLNLTARTGTGLYTFDGGAGTDTLAGPNAVQVWNVTGADAGHINGTNVIVFDAVENLTGGTSNDTFVIGTGGSVSGTISGTAGNDTLRQTDGTNTWNITAADEGNVTDVSAFAGINNLTGGSGDDTFMIGTTGTLTGNLNGGAGNDTVVADNNGNAFMITGTNSGTLGDLAGGFTNIENLTGGSGVDTFTFTTAGSLSGAIAGGGSNDELIGDADGNVFVVNAVDAGVLIGKLSGFTSIENLTGQGADDTFTINANLMGNITGAGGVDTITVAANVTVTGSINADAGNDVITLGANSIVTGTVNGGANSDTLLLETVGADVTLTSTGFSATVTGTAA